MVTSLPPGFTHLALSRTVRTAAARVPDQPAVIFGERALSYRQLVARCNRVANAARSGCGIEPGDRVALIAGNRLEYLEIVLGLSDIGAVAVTVNPASSVSELQLLLSDCDARLVIIDPALPALADAVSAMPIPHVMLGDAYDHWLSQASDTFMPVPVPEWASFCICYTSGTTGLPKGVQLPHRSRVLTALSMGVEYHCFGMNDRFLAVAPLYHGAGLAFALASIAFGGSCLLLDRFDPDAVTAHLAGGDVTGIFMVPTHFSRLFGVDGELRPALPASTRLKTVISNAAALAPRMKQVAVSFFGAGVLHETYGSTEAGIVTNMRPEHLLERPMSVGTPFVASEVEIRDEEGRVCAAGEIGELFSRSPYSFIGYLNRPDDTAVAMVDDWVTVQDLASRDEQGFLTIHGRKKDMIVSGGVNIYPAEIEAVIAAIPGVREVAVVGLPDPQWGEAVHAFIVVDTPASAGEDSVEKTCREQLSAYKVPKSVTALTELPKNPSGKLLKNVLRNRYGKSC